MAMTIEDLTMFAEFESIELRFKVSFVDGERRFVEALAAVGFGSRSQILDYLHRQYEAQLLSGRPYSLAIGRERCNVGPWRPEWSEALEKAEKP